MSDTNAILPVDSPDQLTCEHSAFKCVISHGSQVSCYICWVEQALSESDDNLTDALSRLAEVEAANRWIPCSERMPEEFVYCELFLRGSVVEGFMSLWAGNPKWTSTREPSRAHMAGDVTHWRPLPPPPTEAP